MKFRISFQLKSVDWVVFCFLLFSNLPNAFYSIFLLILIFFIRLASSMKLLIHNEWKTIVLLWSIIGLIMGFSFFTHFSSFNNLLWGVISFVPIILIPFLLPFHKVRYLNSSDRLINAIKLFTFVELIVMALQYIALAFQYKTIDIFSATNGAAGDNIGGTTFGFSSVISITLGFVSIIFLDYYLHYKHKKDLLWFLFSFFMMTLPGYTAGILVYFTSFILFLFGKFVFDLFKRGVVNKRIGIIIMFVLVGFFAFGCLQISNIFYAVRIFSYLFSTDPPMKVKSIISTIEYSSENIIDVPLGIGFGNYSSRAAFITGGEYLSNQPAFIPLTPSKYFKKYMFPLYNLETQHQYRGGVAGNSMVNTPFNQFQTIYGEGGIISLLILCIIAAIVFQVSLPYKGSLYFWGLLYFAFLMFLDNWLSYPNFCLMFWLLILYATSSVSVLRPSLCHAKPIVSNPKTNFLQLS
jgi:hypothetical protein